jgi:OmpA-OmpF porin, OOP family
MSEKCHKRTSHQELYRWKFSFLHGRPERNQRLSAARAAAVAAAIVRQGIADDRLRTAGFGETLAKGDNATLQGRALNRRVELVRTDR